MIPEIASWADGMQKSVVLPSRPYVREPPGVGLPSLAGVVLLELELEPPPPHAAATIASEARSAKKVSVRRRGRMLCRTMVPPYGRAVTRLDAELTVVADVVFVVRNLRSAPTIVNHTRPPQWHQRMERAGRAAAH